MERITCVMVWVPIIWRDWIRMMKFRCLFEVLPAFVCRKIKLIRCCWLDRVSFPLHLHNKICLYRWWNKTFYFLTHLGTGTAPFRSFWQELAEVKSQNPSFEVPKVWLFFGCRTKSLDLYSDEKQEMMENGILNRVFLALSREKNVPKVSLSKCQ